jgi:ferredoxin
MRIIVDVDLCQGHAQCEDAAPDIFQVDDNGLLTVLVESPDESARARVEDAVRRCPAEALQIVED